MKSLNKELEKEVSSYKAEKRIFSALFFVVKINMDYKPKRFIDKKYRTKPPIGYCWCLTHRGYLNPKLLMSHECLEKKCVFLQKYLDQPFWEMKERELIEKQRRKAMKKLKKKMEKNEKGGDIVKLRNLLERMENSLLITIVSNNVNLISSAQKSEIWKMDSLVLNSDVVGIFPEWEEQIVRIEI